MDVLWLVEGEEERSALLCVGTVCCVLCPAKRVTGVLFAVCP